MLAAISALIGPVSAILDKVIPDKDLREKLSHEIATMAERMIQLSEMMPVLMGMLGLGAMRTFEKTKGVSREK